jgi:natural product biosynthesis luciferase-like monooxygenase protein
LTESARFADERGFEAIWVPERHFNAFGGLYPSPVALAGALATITKQIAIRAGSVVLPLHSPVRVAEEWAVIDNLCGGRAGVSFASGWHPDDFVLKPSSWHSRRDSMLPDIDTIRRLWRGEMLTLENGAGATAEIRIFPAPVQDEIPVWLTSTKTPETWLRAAEIGAHILTALLEQSVEELAARIDEYRVALTTHGFDPDTRTVTTMLHTFVGTDIAEVRELVRPPMSSYLRSHISLYERLAKSIDLKIDINAISEADREALVEVAFERYFTTSSLLGTDTTCSQLLTHLRSIGVTEVAALIDFGLEDSIVLEGLERLALLSEQFRDTGNGADVG